MTRFDEAVCHEAPISDRALPKLVIALALPNESAALLNKDRCDAPS
jgi:hypothetical protein